MLCGLSVFKGEQMKRVFMGAVPLLLLLLAVIGCAPATIADKKFVSINYKGTLADGTVFGENTAGQPLEFMMGAGKMIPALEKGLIGLKVGAKKTIEVKAADAYGEYDKTAIQEVPKEQFPTDLTLTVGQQYQVQSGTGTMIVTINAINAKTVTVDFNHPLAGKDLTFAIEVVKIRDATKDELTAAATAAAATQQ
jgi:FKBP-type peptidyl-prolyl cis-trans isomerase 2